MNLLEELHKIISDENRVTINHDVVIKHSHDISYHKPSLPDVVVFPKTKYEVSEVLKFANQNGVPIVPFGIGTSVEGQVIPLLGGISLDMSMMNEVIEFRPNDHCVRVQPGITRVQLNAYLEPYGLFFTVDPGVDATIGGMAATNASGTNTVCYGVMREQILGLEFVRADGKIFRTGGTAKKSSSGYNLTGLLVGSEGTLGVFTELILRIKQIPKYSISARVAFENVKSACDAAILLINNELTIGRIEFVDEKTVRAVNCFKNTTYIEYPTLFIELHGSESTVNEQMIIAKGILAKKYVDFCIESQDNSKDDIWTARRQAALAISASSPHKKLLTTDVCVPLSVLPEAICQARNLIDQYGIFGAILGHVGDGNYHIAFTVNPNDNEEVKLIQRINDDIVRFALNNGGTCSGEHGIGMGKIQYLEKEHSESLSIMLEIKTMMDPNNILNPGKIFKSIICK